MLKFLKICRKNNETHELKTQYIMKRNNTKWIGKKYSKNAKVTTTKEQIEQKQ
jgi:hypothetical protein